MGTLNNVSRACEAYGRWVQAAVREARNDRNIAQKYIPRSRDLHAQIPESSTPTGVMLPRLALPEFDEPGEIARYLLGQGLPGEFPFVNSAYREMYLEPVRAQAGNGKSDGKSAEEPTRLFAGL